MRWIRKICSRGSEALVVGKTKAVNKGCNGWLITATIRGGACRAETSGWSEMPRVTGTVTAASGVTVVCGSYSYLFSV